jgi:uncharacterized damage-inducible protein DinB
VSEERRIISTFNEYSTWVSSFEDMDESLWSLPISENKWSVSEIVSHLMNWDKHLLSEILPSVCEGKGMNFPEFDTYNKIASDYVSSGVSQSKLIREAKDTRDLLVNELQEMSVEKLCQPLAANGVSHCPHTGTPYSLMYIIKEFIDHDNHHKEQIMEYIRKNSLG